MTGMIAWNPAELGFEQIPTGDHTVSLMHLLAEPETGMEIAIVRYESGEITPLHFHECGHGMYIISGRIRTTGSVHGPGEVLWFPEGCVDEHGATEDGPAQVFFFTNKPFNITLIEQGH